MAKLTYSEQLKDPRWQRKRLEVLEAANWTCCGCSSTTKTLHVHHRMYIKGKMAWEYPSEMLAVLCDECHEEEHNAEELLKIVLLGGAAYPMPVAKVAAGLVAGYMHGGGYLHEEYAEAARDFNPIHFRVGLLAMQLALSGAPELLSAFESLLPETKVVGYDELHGWLKSRAGQESNGKDQNNQA